MQADSNRDNAGSQNENGPYVESCNVQLDIFEGPLDLLLYLIRKEEIEIYDIPIARITEQYLHYLEMMKVLNLNFAGEFLAMAATLLFIKSRMLLPPEERTEEEEEPVEDPRAELVRQLVEYKQFKDAAEELQGMEAEHQRTFRRHDASVPSLDLVGRPLSDVSIFDLLSAFSRLLERAAEEEEVQEIAEEEVTLSERLEAILVRLEKEREILFDSLFPERASRMLIVVTFLALLELVRTGRIAAVQERPFAEIRILAR